MARIEAWKCDVCGKLSESISELTLTKGRDFSIRAKPPNTWELSLCSPECAKTALAEWIEHEKSIPDTEATA